MSIENDGFSNSENNIVVELKGVSKHFGGVTALKNVDFQLYAGEIHGLVGENGAGKSTLVKILSGVHVDYEGEMVFKGRVERFHSPADARLKGIGTVYQELSVVRSLSVAENLFLGRQPINRLGLVDWPRMYKEASVYLEQLGVEVDVRRSIGSYSIGIQQLVEVARVIFGGASVIILDEPTSALSAPEAERLFEFMRRLKAQGKTLIFISHFLEDVLNISDRVTVMRNGKRVYTGQTQGIDKSFVVRQMLGEEAHLAFENHTLTHRRQTVQSDVVLEVKNFSKKHEFHDINFKLYKGEILGIYGFMGAGKTALANCLFGFEVPDRGEVIINQKPIRLGSTTESVKMGLAYVPNNRRQSIFPGKELYKNITLPCLRYMMQFVLNQQKEIGVTQEQIQKVHLTPPNPMLFIDHLSGGNQQKAILAKWLVRLPTVLILNEPTRGIDIGAKEEVLQLVNRLREEGVSIILLSSEPEIILGYSDRILVMSKGKIRKELWPEHLTKEQLMQWA